MRKQSAFHGDFAKPLVLCSSGLRNRRKDSQHTSIASEHKMSFWRVITSLFKMSTVETVSDSAASNSADPRLTLGCSSADCSCSTS